MDSSARSVLSSALNSAAAEVPYRVPTWGSNATTALNTGGKAALARSVLVIAGVLALVLAL